jgi:hypothetical protein
VDRRNQIEAGVVIGVGMALNALTHVDCVALLVTGVKILISRPRFYWGEAGNSLNPRASRFLCRLREKQSRLTTVTFCPTRMAGADTSTLKPHGLGVDPLSPAS